MEYYVVTIAGNTYSKRVYTQTEAMNLAVKLRDSHQATTYIDAFKPGESRTVAVYEYKPQS